MSPGRAVVHARQRPLACPAGQRSQRLNFTKGRPMKIVVIGGTGLIGSKVVAILREQGHEAVAASPRQGINSLTGEGLAEALAGAAVVVDVSNSPSFEPAAVLSFFETSTRNLLAAEAAAGVGHHVALSIVGIDRSPDNGYFKAKIAQEAADHLGSNPLHDCARHAVHGVRRRHRGRRDIWRRGAHSSGGVPADRRRRRRASRRKSRGQRAAERSHGNRRS